MMSKTEYRRLRPYAVLLAAGAFITHAGPAHAQVGRQSLSDAARPAVRAVRIEASEAPVIDGDLSDPVWAKAAVIDRLVQTEPDNGKDNSERTVVRILYDSENLYFGVYAYDHEPDKIVATIKSRDGILPKDDFVRVALDPYKTRRDAYAFEFNPLGSRGDALIQNNSEFLINWNIIWAEKSRFVADGWTAEVVIPFRNLSFDPNSTEWGFDVVRAIKRKAEWDRWGLAPANVTNFDVAYSGNLTGLTGMTQGTGLDLQVYAGTRYKHQSAGTDDNDVTFHPSGNLYYKITPSLTGTLTVNTDFSDAPLDRRQVNTTRFGLFTQETRQFFLQDSASFEFGGKEFQQQMENGRPFFSRNIGLVSGYPVSILGGGKLSGDFEGINIGALTAQTNGTDTTDGQLLSVARMTVPVFSESKIGVIGTNGDPTGKTKNSLGGVDFQFRDSNFLTAGKRFLSDDYFVRSFSNTKGDDNAYGGSLQYPNEPWLGEVYYKHIGQNFAPALGFVNRTGINEYRSRLAYRERYPSGYLRWFDTAIRNNFTFGLDNHLQSRDNGIAFQVFTTDGDGAQFTVHNIGENVAKAFFLPNKTRVAAGNYEWTYWSPRFETSQARPFSVTWDGECCEFYDGHYVKSDLSLDYRPDTTWEFIFQHTMTLIRLPKDQVDIHIASFDIATNFTPDMQLRTQIQYDNITKRFQLLARYRWEYTPDSEFFVSVGETSAVTGPFFGPRYVPNNTQVLIRIGHTFQF